MSSIFHRTLQALFVSFLLTLVILPQQAYGQSGLQLGHGVILGDTTQLQVLTTTKFDKIQGYSVDISGNELVFRPRNMTREMRFALEDVRSLRLFSEPLLANQLSDPTYLRTALPGEKGGARYRNLMLLGSLAEFDVTDNLRLGVGVFLPVGLAATIRTQLSLSNSIHIGISNQSVFPLFAGDLDSGLAGDLSGILTLGNSRTFLSASYHLLYDTDFLGDEHAFGLAVGGQISSRWHLYSELFFVEQQGRGSGFIPSFSASYRANRWRIRMGLFAGFLDIFTDTPLPFLGADYYW